MPVCDDKKVIFLHIPKTGGTTIRKLLGINQFVDENPDTTPSPQHLTARLLRDQLGKRFDAYYKFTFARNPWSRAVSDFAWRQFLADPWKPRSFDQFISYVSDRVKSRNFYDRPFDDHLIPQVHFTGAADDVFRFEEFESGVREAAAKVGVEIDAIPTRPTRPRPDYWTYYDENSKAIIADLYRDDIEELGYDFLDGS